MEDGPQSGEHVVDIKRPQNNTPDILIHVVTHDGRDAVVIFLPGVVLLDRVQV